MKQLIIAIVALVATATIGCQPTKVADDNRDYAYEAYCDSLWENDKDFYLDVLCETDEYQTYIEQHGEWWH